MRYNLNSLKGVIWGGYIVGRLLRGILEVETVDYMGIMEKKWITIRII